MIQFYKKQLLICSKTKTSCKTETRFVRSFCLILKTENNDTNH